MAQCSRHCCRSLRQKSFKTNSIRLIVRRFIEFVWGVLVHAVEPGRGPKIVLAPKTSNSTNQIIKRKIKNSRIVSNQSRRDIYFEFGNVAVATALLFKWKWVSECVCCVVRLHDFLCKDLCVNFLIEFNLRGMRFVFGFLSNQPECKVWQCEGVNSLYTPTSTHSTHTSHILNAQPSRRQQKPTGNA